MTAPFGLRHMKAEREQRRLDSSIKVICACIRRTALPDDVIGKFLACEDRPKLHVSPQVRSYTWADDACCSRFCPGPPRAPPCRGSARRRDGPTYVGRRSSPFSASIASMYLSALAGVGVMDRGVCSEASRTENYMLIQEGLDLRPTT